MAWSNAQRAFAVEAIIRNDDSVVMALHAFHTQFQIPPRVTVPDHKSIVLWIENFRGIGSVVKKRGKILHSACTHRCS